MRTSEAGRRDVDRSLAVSAKRASNILRRIASAARDRRLIRRSGQTFVLGNQKSGTTVIAALLAKAINGRATLDVFCRLSPRIESELYEDPSRFEEFAKLNRTLMGRCVVKEPSFSLFAPQLYSLYPHANYVHVVRHPFDNIRSILNRLGLAGDKDNLSPDDLLRLSELPLWKLVIDGTLAGHAGSNYVETLARRWILAVRRVEESIPGVHTVTYESFCENKQQAIEHLCRRLGYTVREDIRDDVSHQFQPIGDRFVNLEDFFGSRRLDQIWKTVSPVADRFGYERDLVRTNVESHGDA